MTAVTCTDEIREELKKTELIVFDVDGVLIDTKPSFIETIIITAKYYINETLELPLDLSGLTTSHAMDFKSYSGFNNDWNLTTALVAFLLYNNRSGNGEIGNKEFLREVDKLGGGMEGVKEHINNIIDKQDFEWIYERVDHPLIRKTFQEFYAGNEYCEHLYGYKPAIYNGSGTIKNEIVLLDRSLIDRWQGKTGILTGRYEKETEIALELTGLADINRELVQFADYIVPDKPHPAKMEKIIDISECGNVLFIGDSIDDFLTTENYNKLGRDVSLQFGLVNDPDSDYPEKAKRFSAGSVNELLYYVIEMKSV